MAYGTGNSGTPSTNVITNFAGALQSALNSSGQGTGLGASLADLKARKAEIYDFSQAPITATGLDDYTTIGPGANEISSLYSPDGDARGGAHYFRIYNLISPDIVLVHQSKMVGFYLKTGTRDKLNHVTRRVKKLLLRDNNVPLDRLRATSESGGLFSLSVPWVDKAANLTDNPSTAMSIETQAKNFLGGFFSV